MNDSMDTSSLGARWRRSDDAELKWTRRLIAGGYFCYKAATQSIKALEREAISLVAHVRIELGAGTGSGFTDLLRAAWLRTRYDYPDIATTAEGEGIRTYRTGVAEVQSWLNETFVVSGQSVHEIRFEATPQRYAMLYWLPASFELALCSSHWRLDGIGCVLLLKHILDQISTPTPMPISNFGNETLRLTPDLFCAFPNHDESGNGNLISQQGEQRCKELSCIDIDKSFILPQISPSTTPSGHQQLRLQFSVPETAKIIDACRHKKFSVTAVVHAAYAMALLNHNNYSQGIYASSGRVQFRPFLQPPYDSPSTNAASMWTAVEAMSISVNTKEFISTATAFSSFYRALLTRLRNDHIGPSLNAMFIYLADNPNGLNVLMALPYLTSLGNLDTTLPSSYISPDGSLRLSVTDFSFSSAQMGKGVGGFLWTFDRKLTLDVGCNAAFYSEQTVSAFLDQVKTVLITELPTAVDT